VPSLSYWSVKPPESNKSGVRLRKPAIPRLDGLWSQGLGHTALVPRSGALSTGGLEKPPHSLQDISGTAPVRLWQRSRRLIARGHHATGGTVAMVRAFDWTPAPAPRLVAQVPDGSCRLPLTRT
jgi:hypothetical protein